jgi:hypothetical protein
LGSDEKTIMTAELVIIFIRLYGPRLTATSSVRESGAGETVLVPENKSAIQLTLSELKDY